MTNAPLLPISALTPMDPENVPPGSIAYLTTGKAFALFALGNGERLILDLGGDKPFAAWQATEDYGTALVVADWRIEIQPTSAVDVKHERLSAGQAFIAGKDVGIVGYRAPGHGLPLAITSSGTLNVTSSNAQRGAFTRWRIVTGPAERSFVLADSEQLALALA